MNVPKAGLLSNPFHCRKNAVKGVFEQMAAIERHHWNEVREPEKDVDPHKPEKEIDKEK